MYTYVVTYEDNKGQLLVHEVTADYFAREAPGGISFYVSAGGVRCPNHIAAYFSRVLSVVLKPEEA